MCNYCGCGMNPYWAYSLYQYPMTYASYPNYGIPLGYAYATPVVAPAPVAPPVYFAGPARGEYRAGNCLMICQ